MGYTGIVLVTVLLAAMAIKIKDIILGSGLGYAVAAIKDPPYGRGWQTIMASAALVAMAAIMSQVAW